jgi:hypothetical protein
MEEIFEQNRNQSYLKNLIKFGQSNGLKFFVFFSLVRNP